VVSKPAAMFLTLIGVLTVGLGVANHLAISHQSKAWERKTIELVDAYRFGTANRSFDEELAEIQTERELAASRSRRRMGGTVALGLLMLIVGMAFLWPTPRGRRDTR
jgi:ferric-dicitrate binding protein FerR (iron transport regulator)